MSRRVALLSGRVILLLFVAISLFSREATASIYIAKYPVNLNGDLPPGFAQEVVVKGLDGPTAFAIAPDGRIYIAQKSGAVRVFNQGKLLSEDFIDLSHEVNHAYDRGLVGITLHPNFARTHWVYLAYTYQPPEANSHKEMGARLARVIRVTADPNNLNKALPTSTVIILGAKGTFAEIGNPDRPNGKPSTCQDTKGAPVRDCIPVEGTAHQANMMQFGKDGALYVSVGDGTDEPALGLRSQDMNSLSGKILRINPVTGVGYNNNPFYNGDPNSNRSKVFMLGLRNPFRFSIHPTTGELFIADVGQSNWEEVNHGRRGANFGWPCYEGTVSAMANPLCDKLQAAGSKAVFPIYAFPHTEGRSAIIGGDFYTGALFPPLYRNVYFFGEYNLGEIWTMTMVGQRVEVQKFAQHLSGVVQITTGLDGHLYLLSIRAGTLYRIRWVSS